MLYLNKDTIREKIQSNLDESLATLRQEISKNLLGESKEYKLFNWKTETYLSEDIYTSKLQAKEALALVENKEDFLIELQTPKSE